MANILVVAAHPDDELLGVGGTLAKHVSKGDTVHSIIVGQGGMSRAGTTPEDVTKLKEDAILASQIIGTCKPIFLGFSDNRLDAIDLLDVIKELEKKCLNLEIETIYTHYGSDLNVDHRIVHEAVVTAFRPKPGSVIKNIYAFETLSSTEWSTKSIGSPFSPNKYINISTTLERKIDALKVYKTEMKPFPHPRSIKSVRALAQLRGSSIGVEAAEAFDVILDIEK